MTSMLERLHAPDPLMDRDQSTTARMLPSGTARYMIRTCDARFRNLIRPVQQVRSRYILAGQKPLAGPHSPAPLSPYRSVDSQKIPKGFPRRRRAATHSKCIVRAGRA
jgi:hypothetical protein